jgi:uncharacterized membrane protein
VEVARNPGGALQADLHSLAAKSAARTLRSGIVARRLVYGGAAVYSLLFVGVAAAHFEAFRAGRADLGWMAQAVWSTAHGHFLESTTVAGREISRLGVHVDPFLALLVPAWLVWPSPLMLQVVQAIAVASGALPVFWLARKHLQSDRAAVHFAFAYLLFPATQFGALTITSGFHAVSIAIPLILACSRYWQRQLKRRLRRRSGASASGTRFAAANGCWARLSSRSASASLSSTSSW